MMDMLQHWQPLAVFLVGLGLAWVRWSLGAQLRAVSADFASAAEHKTLAVRVDGYEGRLVAIEHTVKHLPTAEQIAALAISISEVRGDIRSVATDVTATKDGVNGAIRRIDLLDQHLLRGA